MSAETVLYAVVRVVMRVEQYDTSVFGDGATGKRTLLLRLDCMRDYLKVGDIDGFSNFVQEKLASRNGDDYAEIVDLIFEELNIPTWTCIEMILKKEDL